MKFLNLFIALALIATPTLSQRSIWAEEGAPTETTQQRQTNAQALPTVSSAELKDILKEVDAAQQSYERKMNLLPFAFFLPSFFSFIPAIVRSISAQDKVRPYLYSLLTLGATLPITMFSSSSSYCHFLELQGFVLKTDQIKLKILSTMQAIQEKLEGCPMPLPPLRAPKKSTESPNESVSLRSMVGWGMSVSGFLTASTLLPVFLGSLYSNKIEFSLKSLVYGAGVGAIACLGDYFLFSNILDRTTKNAEICSRVFFANLPGTSYIEKLGYYRVSSVEQKLADAEKLLQTPLSAAGTSEELNKMYINLYRWYAYINTIQDFEKLETLQSNMEQKLKTPAGNAAFISGVIAPWALGYVAYWGLKKFTPLQAGINYIVNI